MTKKTDEEILADLVMEKLKEDDLFDFDGHNCHYVDQDCGGWDGVSRRCNCGNRRVTWVLSDDKSYVYAEAY
jgi:uncharacterized protein (DUF1786 family)